MGSRKRHESLSLRRILTAMAHAISNGLKLGLVEEDGAKWIPVDIHEPETDGSAYPNEGRAEEEAGRNDTIVGPMNLVYDCTDKMGWVDTLARDRRPTLVRVLRVYDDVVVIEGTKGNEHFDVVLRKDRHRCFVVVTDT